MNKKLRIQAFFFVLVTQLFAYAQLFCADHEPTEKIKQPTRQLTVEQKSQVATDTLIKYFEQMIEKNVLGITGLERLAESPSVISPILPEQYHTSDLVDTFKTQLDTLLEKGKDWFDLARIKTWVQTKIQELENRERTRQHVHEETREVHIPMRFVEISAGKYQDAITHEEFEILSGTELQETPITQLQWAQVMGENPSHFIDGVDSEEVSVGGKKIKMRPDAPVENVSYNQVQEFITKLNERDKNNTNYIYALPSAQEYQALMQSVLGSNWLEQTQHVKTCGDTEKTCTVTSGDYMLTHNKQRVFGLVGGIWQWTRDMVELEEQQHGFVDRAWQWTRDMVGLGRYKGEGVGAHLVFGRAYSTRGSLGVAVNELLRPMWHGGSFDKNIGIRLVRHAKREACERAVNRYSHDILSWNEKDAGYDRAWHWNKKLSNLLSDFDELAWMIKHKSDYPRETQHTIDVLLKKVPAGHDPIVYLKGVDKLGLFFKLIQDLSPLANLTNLIDLRLNSNYIQDLSPLANLTGLAYLRLDCNQIQDLSSLANLTNLINLCLDCNQIQDLSPLVNLTNLTGLYLEQNQIQDLSPLANLTNLTGLYLRNNKIEDLSFLANLTKLTQLDLCKNQIEDLSFLANLTNLTYLDLCKNQIEDLSFLANLTNLAWLYLKNNPIKDFSPLSQLKKLTLFLDKKQLDQLGANAKSILPYADIKIGQEL